MTTRIAFPPQTPCAGARLSLLATVAVSCLALAALAAPPPGPARADAVKLPIRGIHLSAPSKRDLPAALVFIREALPKEGVNTLILEFDFSFDFRSRPEFADPSALGSNEVRQIVAACRAQGIELIPQINCLGHQSWAKQNGRLLQKHPEFDETPGKYPGNTNIYCRSYCPLHPEVHAVMFDLVNELVRACEARAFHVGLDEVFILADPDCPRCQGKSPAALFAGEVRTLHAHLKTVGCRMWMWGDRFIDGKATRIGKWEASEDGTHAAIDQVPKDIVICDWHYDSAPDTARFFAGKGFDVVECPWRKPAVALAQWQQIRALRSDPALGRHALGMVQTTWCGFSAFARAYEAQSSGVASDKNSAAEAARCFVKLFEEIRKGP